VSTRGLPAIEAAVRFWIFVQRCGCSSLALCGLWNALPRASHSVAALSLYAMRHLRQPGTAANRRRKGSWSYIRGVALAATACGAVRAVPAEFFLAKADITRGTGKRDSCGRRRRKIL